MGYLTALMVQMKRIVVSNMWNSDILMVVPDPEVGPTLVHYDSLKNFPFTTSSETTKWRLFGNALIHCIMKTFKFRRLKGKVS